MKLTPDGGMNFVYKMMIVEDELFVRIGLEHAVNWADYGIQLLPSASNGREALELYEQYHPHLILTDISMPEIDGLELIRRIRDQDKTVKFIVLTCLEDYQTAKQVLNLSVSHYYNKSELDIEELKTYITGIIAELDQQGTPRGEESPQAAPKNGLKEWNAFFFEGKPCPFEELLAPYKQPGSAYILARVDFQKMGRVHFEFVRRVLEEILEQQKSGHCLAVSEKFAAVLYVLGAPSPEQQYEQLHRYIQHLKQSMQDYLGRGRPPDDQRGPRPTSRGTICLPADPGCIAVYPGTPGGKPDASRSCRAGKFQPRIFKHPDEAGTEHRLR